MRPVEKSNSGSNTSSAASTTTEKTEKKPQAGIQQRLSNMLRLLKGKNSAPLPSSEQTAEAAHSQVRDDPLGRSAFETSPPTYEEASPPHALPGSGSPHPYTQSAQSYPNVLTPPAQSQAKHEASPYAHQSQAATPAIALGETYSVYDQARAKEADPATQTSLTSQSQRNTAYATENSYSSVSVERPQQLDISQSRTRRPSAPLAPQQASQEISHTVKRSRSRPR